ncbi:MAG: DMT family transporter [Methylococcaceae bacterium]|nr:DMT family transporter [Methylococcaceae bacterium]
MDTKLIGVCAALGSAASWALGAILFKQLGDSIPPIAMTLAKGAVSAILLGLALLAVGYEELDGTPLCILVASGLLGISAGDTFFFAALRDLGAYAVVVLLMLGQVLTVVLAVLLLDEQLSIAEQAGIALTIAGVSLVLFIQARNEPASKSRLLGIFYGSMSIICMSASLLIAKPVLETTSSIQATFIRMFAGMLGILLFGVIGRQLNGFFKPFTEFRLAGRFVLSVCIVTFGGFWLSLVAVKYLDVSIANTLNSTEPLFVLPLAVIFLKERITWLIVLGSVMAFAGVAMLIGGWIPV